MIRINLALFLAVVVVGSSWAAADRPPVRFNKNFQGASLGKIEAVSPGVYRCYVPGQYDERGRNRQVTWYSFRVDNVKDLELTLILTDFVGEYNDKPGAVGLGDQIVPVRSADGRAWEHFLREEVTWDKDKKELTLKFTPTSDSIWIAHIQPYTHQDLQKLIREIEKTGRAVMEVIGKSCQGRDIHQVTVTDLSVPDAQKRTVWLQARQHAWEAGTSYAMEGALRFITSEDPKAAEMRKKIIFKFTPMVDVDGCVNGNVRFNMNGFDVNRHWPEVDLRDPQMLKLMPEIWYTKKAILAWHREHPIDLMVNMHNTETGEFFMTQNSDPAVVEKFKKLEQLMIERSSYEPKPTFALAKPGMPDTNSLGPDHKVPVALLELRISTAKKLGRWPTAQDRIALGRELLIAIAEVVE